MIKVEVCINCDGAQSVKDSVEAAYLGGASTIELCGAMHVNGLTPKMSQIVEARKAFKNRHGLM
ncbi:MAG: copper homeostasis protein CutC, partial [Melioribacteraceae bacterium]